MPSVPLDFIPPGQENIIALHIFEAPAPDGPFAEIEVVSPVGTFPDYLSHYTTNNAGSYTNWFRISWEDDKGAMGPQSPSMQGGTFTLFQKVITRVMERNRFIDERVLAQEVEYVISLVMHTEDPYDPTLTATIAQVAGMVYLTMARSQLVTLLIEQTGDVSQVTLGLVMMKKGTGTTITTKMADIQALIDLANSMLGISLSLVMQAEELACNYGLASWDHSRLIGYYGLE